MRPLLLAVAGLVLAGCVNSNCTPEYMYNPMTGRDGGYNYKYVCPGSDPGNMGWISADSPYVGGR